MANTIITKNSSTASAVPSAGSLTQGELAVNVTDKKLYTKDSGGSVVEITPTNATNATNVTGTTTASIPTSALASGTADSSKVLLGDRTWGTLSGGVTSLNGETGAITNTSINSIGSYCFAHELNQETNPGFVVGSTYSPSNLYSYSVVGVYTAFSSYGLTGTWRCMPGSRTAPPGSGASSREAPLVRVS